MDSSQTKTYTGLKSVLVEIDRHVTQSELDSRTNPHNDTLKAVHKAWLKAQKAVVATLAKMNTVD